MLVERVYNVSERFFGIPTFFNYAIADELYKLLLSDKTGFGKATKPIDPEFHLRFNFLK